MGPLLLFAFRILLLNLAVALVIGFGLFAVQVNEQRHTELARADERLELAAHTLWLLLETPDSTVTAEWVQDRISRFCDLMDNRLMVHVRTQEGATLYASANIKLTGSQFMENGPSTLAPVSVELFNETYRLHSISSGLINIAVAHPLLTFVDAGLRVSSMFGVTVALTAMVLLVGGFIAGMSVITMVRKYSAYLQRQIDDADRRASFDAFPPVSVGWRILMGPIFDIVHRLLGSRNQALAFASYASHELRSPLAIMRSQLEGALGEHVGATSLRRTIGSTYDDVLRLHRIIDDLLSLATMQAGTYRLNRVPVEFNRFLKEFSQEARLLSQPSEVKILVKRGPAADVMIDVQRFRQVLFNLLDNSLKFTQPKGQIRISSTIEATSVVLTFSDTGKGISTEALPYVFQPFYRDPQSSGVRGSGLGLALVRWIVDLHGGSVAVASDPGHGTTFTLRIPREFDIPNV